MLPPYTDSQTFAHAAFVRRLLHPFSLIDWHQAVVECEYALFRPNKLALTTLQRLRLRGHLSRDDPGVFLMLVYLTLTSGLTYGIAVYASHRHRLSLFSILHGFMVMPAVALALAITLASFALYHLLYRVARSKKLFLAAQVAAKSTWGRLLGARSQDHDDSSPEGMTWRGGRGAPGDQYDLLFYCFDLVCNALIPALVILCPLQYLLLPLVLAGHPESNFAIKFVSAAIANCLHAGAAVAFSSSVCNGVAAAPQPFSSAAPLVYIPCAVWLVMVVILTCLSVNLTEIYFALAFGRLFD